jgi:hypothetical protein
MGMSVFVGKDQLNNMESSIWNRLQNISKTGEDSRGLEGTPREKKRPGKSKIFTQ